MRTTFAFCALVWMALSVFTIWVRTASCNHFGAHSFRGPVVPLVLSPVAGSILSSSAYGQVVVDGIGMSMHFFMMSEKRASLPPMDSL